MDPPGRTIAGLGSGLQATAWRDGHAHALALPPGADYLALAGINAQGWIAGTARPSSGMGGQAWVWRPRANGSGYDALALGNLPGMTDAVVAGIDDAGRVYGQALPASFGSDGEPFVWSPAEGMRSLTALGYPGEAPQAVSRGGAVATSTLTWRFGQPGQAEPVAPPPASFAPHSFSRTGAVNDDGVRAGFLLSNAGQHINQRFLARHSAGGGWQVMTGPIPGASWWSAGTVDAAGTLTATALGAGWRAAGPRGKAQPVAGRVWPSYGRGIVTAAGDQGEDGSLVANFHIGQSARLVKLVPAAPCTGAACVRVSRLKMTGRVAWEPGKTGQCTDGARNHVKATVSVVDADGLPLPGATVRARFMDDGVLDAPASAVTRASGSATLRHQGPACVGAVALLVEDVIAPGRQLDRSSGRLVHSVLPR